MVNRESKIEVFWMVEKWNVNFCQQNGTEKQFILLLFEGK